MCSPLHTAIHISSLRGFWHCHPYILLHLWKMFFILVYLVCVVFGTAIPTSFYILENVFHTCIERCSSDQYSTGQHQWWQHWRGKGVTVPPIFLVGWQCPPKHSSILCMGNRAYMYLAARANAFYIYTANILTFVRKLTCTLV